MAKKTFEQQIVDTFQKTMLADLKDRDSYIFEEVNDAMAYAARKKLAEKMKTPAFVKVLDTALDKALTEKELVKVVKLQVAKSLSGG